MTRIMFIVLALLFLVACSGKSSTLLTQDFQRTVLERTWEPSNPGRDSIEGTFYGSNHAEVGGIFVRNQLHGAFGVSQE